MVRQAVNRALRKPTPGWPTFFARVGLLGAAVALMAGCSGPAADQPGDEGDRPVDTSPVRLLVVDDPPLAAVIRREWAARGTGAISVVEGDSQNLRGAGRLDVDAVIYPSRWIGELIQQRLIEPVPADVLAAEPLAWQDIFRLPRLKETSWGGRTFAFPLGSPQLVVFYRVDVFEELQLAPPETWHEYRQVVGRLALHTGQLKKRSSAADASTDDISSAGGGPNAAPTAGTSDLTLPAIAAVEPLAAGWASEVLLSRAAPYARHRSQFSTLFDFTSMQPLIDGPPFVRALEELVAAAKHGPPEPWQVTPAEARRLFFEGTAAMALAWPTRAGESGQTASAEPDQRSGPAAAAETPRAETAPADSMLPAACIGFAPLPGSRETYSIRGGAWEQRRADESPRVPLLGLAGRLASVTRESPRARRAFAVLAWLGGRQWSGVIASESTATTLFRTSHLRSPGNWVPPEVDEATATRYADLVEQTQSSPVWLTCLRLPGQQEYLDVLDGAVERAVRGEASPAEALEEAARRWDEITDRIGREQQRLAYEASIGISP